MPLMSHRAISTPLIAWIAAPRRPNQTVCSYIRLRTAPMSPASKPTTASASP